jgi:hypothetical protein
MENNTHQALIGQAGDTYNVFAPPAEVTEKPLEPGNMSSQRWIERKMDDGLRPKLFCSDAGSLEVR